jgi:dihydroxy-acid dehydratase
MCVDKFRGTQSDAHEPQFTGRSQQWFAQRGGNGLVYRSFMKKQGIPDHLLDGRPVVGICNTWSELAPCNSHLRDLAERVRRGVFEAGGLPLEFPVMALGESLMRPTAMLFRNLCSMDVEETVRANPLDGIVLLAGCDKTTPALLMGAASCGLPTILVSGGPMLNGKYRGEDIGSGSVWRFTEGLATGEVSQSDMLEIESCIARSTGHCMTMGTASTMAILGEALGIALAGNGTVPAPDSRRLVLAHESGRKIVDLVRNAITIDQILTRDAFHNAIVVCAAVGGSTNAVVHLQAIAGRLGVQLSIDDWDNLSRDVPCLVNVAPVGKYLMEDLHYAGGLLPVLEELRPWLHLNAQTVAGPLGNRLGISIGWDSDVVKTTADPVKSSGGVAVLRGNLAPRGAIIKIAASSPSLWSHRGPAVVFEDFDDYRLRIDADDLDVTEASILVLRNCGPVGFPGFPEVGNMRLPKKLINAGVSDMIRISDARMSGTAYGTVILHVTPESAAGGPLGLVRDGDMIELDVEGRRIHLDVSDTELERRSQEVTSSSKVRPSERGYVGLYRKHVLQADHGADFDFLVGNSGHAVGADVIAEPHWSTHLGEL